MSMTSSVPSRFESTGQAEGATELPANGPQPRPKPRPGILEIAPYVGGKSKAPGTDTPIKLSSNETPLGPAPEARQAFLSPAAGLEQYPDGKALALKQAIAQRYDLNPAGLMLGNGSDEVLQLLAQAYLGPGDEAIFSEHTFLVYSIVTRANGAVPVRVPEKNYRADVEGMIAALTPRTRMVFLANPDNPTGSYLGRSSLERLLAALPPEALLVLDGAYAEYATADDYDDGLSFARAHPNVVATRTFSKLHGLAALRLGWGFADPEIAGVYERIRGPFNVSSPAQAAGIAALQAVDWEERSVAHNTTWRAFLLDGLLDLGLKALPSEANFVMVVFEGACGEARAMALEDFLLTAGIIVRRLPGQGLPHALRISVGTEEGCRRLMEACKAFQAERGGSQSAERP